MSDLQEAFPPIRVRDNVPAVCVAVAVLGLAFGGFVVAARMQPPDAQIAANAGVQEPPTP
jgi:hypothetical protein